MNTPLPTSNESPEILHQHLRTEQDAKRRQR
jgi:hypothetical protein